MASAAADTWANELGTFLGKNPRKIINFKKCLPGESGGITIPGTIASLIGAASIGFTGFILSNSVDVKVLILILLAGFVGALVDSLVGATIQAQYKCPQCNKITEKLKHCGDNETKLIKGIKWINNDVVNWICTLSGAVLVLIFIL